MVDARTRIQTQGQDAMQNVELPGVLGQGNVSVQNARGERMLNTGALRTHHAHLSSEQGGRRRRSAYCPVCKHGMAALLVRSEKAVPSGGVVQSGGGDVEGDTAYARDNGESKWPD
jgi:hypothetical protein